MAWRIVLIVLVSLFVTASVMPIVLMNVPAARDESIGMALVIAITAVTFLVIWGIWWKFGSRT
jgi:hypothetical protein